MHLKSESKMMAAHIEKKEIQNSMIQSTINSYNLRRIRPSLPALHTEPVRLAPQGKQPRRLNSCPDEVSLSISLLSVLLRLTAQFTV